MALSRTVSIELSSIKQFYYSQQMGATALSIITFSIMPFSITAPSKMTFSIMTLSKMTFSITTLSKMTFSITINKMQH